MDPIIKKYEDKLGEAITNAAGEKGKEKINEAKKKIDAYTDYVEGLKRYKHNITDKEIIIE